jgi:acetylornithine deacetylase
MDAREKKIMQSVDALAGDLLDFTRRLVAQPSVLGNEAGCVRVMEEELRRLGLAPVRVPIDPTALAGHPGFAPVPWEYAPGDGRDNLVASLPAAGAGGRSCLFNGHLDVVSPEPVDFWSADPFAPREEGGWLYGRGAGDMKSGVAAMTYALQAVRHAGFGLNADCAIEAVIEEECCGNGALACVVAGWDADAVLIPEPFGPTLLTDQVGVLWFKVAISGKPSHVLSTQSGANAIEKCQPLFAALRRLEEEMNEAPRPEAYRTHPHPLNLNIGVIEGGDWPSTVPAFAEFHCRLSFFPGTPYEAVCERIRDAVAEAAQADPWLRENPPAVVFYGFRSQGHTLPPNTDLARTLDDCHQELTGEAVQPYVATCTTDLRAFFSYGNARATCYGPVAENIHAADERVHVDSILHTARAYALFLARWCGLAE